MKEETEKILVLLWADAREAVLSARRHTRLVDEAAWRAGAALSQLREKMTHEEWLSELKEREIDPSEAERYIKSV